MKKFLGLFAVALISVCFITGCGNDKNDSMTDTTSQTSQTSNTQETSKSMTENGEVSDSDGFIGNEENETGNSGSDIMDDIEDELTILWVTEIIMILILSPIPQILFYKNESSRTKLPVALVFNTKYVIGSGSDKNHTALSSSIFNWRIIFFSSLDM